MKKQTNKQAQRINLISWNLSQQQQKQQHTSSGATVTSAISKSHLYSQQKGNSLRRVFILLLLLLFVLALFAVARRESWNERRKENARKSSMENIIINANFDFITFRIKAHNRRDSATQRLVCNCKQTKQVRK